MRNHFYQANFCIHVLPDQFIGFSANFQFLSFHYNKLRKNNVTFMTNQQSPPVKHSL